MKAKETIIRSIMSLILSCGVEKDIFNILEKKFKTV